MIPPSLALLLLFSIHSCSALTSTNGSALHPRTFSSHVVMVTDEPIDYIDPSVLDLYLSFKEDGDVGSGLEVEPVSKHGVHRTGGPFRKHYFVSEENKAFLRGHLLTSFVPAVYTLVFIVSVPLNLIATVLFGCRIHPKKPAVVYMCNLACADLLLGLLLPFKISYRFNGNSWIYGSFLCRVVTAAFYCNMYCSVLLIMCISVDRFLAVVYPLKSLTWRSPGTASAVCIAMWLLALCGVVPLLISEQTLHLSDLNITTCHDVQDPEIVQFYHVYFFPIYSAVFFFIPLILTMGFYVCIIRALAATNVETRSKKTRAMIMTVLVLLLFVVCFTPTNIILLLHYVQLAQESSDRSYQAYLLSLCVGTVSCCLDPLVYYFGSSQCQRQVAALLRCRRLARSKSGSNSTRTSRWTDSTRSSRI